MPLSGGEVARLLKPVYTAARLLPPAAHRARPVNSDTHVVTVAT